MEQRAHFNQKLDELRMQVLRMASMAQEAVSNAVTAFIENDSDLAEDVIVNDDKINALENEIDKFNLELLALDQPMARDLRLIVGAMRITVNLERLGDEAGNLAHRAVFLSTRSEMEPAPKMRELAETAKDMLNLAVRAYADEDSDLASKICMMDNKADQLNVDILKDFISQMVGESRIVERGVHSIMAARHLERIADLATNVAECVIFIVDGENVKHGNCRGEL
ncbi:MAG: phosphate signaling complex protein PhoU [Desulfovibrio sp.]